MRLRPDDVGPQAKAASRMGNGVKHYFDVIGNAVSFHYQMAD
jgi:hypothetical protein